MTIKEALIFGVSQLSGTSSARLDCEILLSHVLRRPLTFLLAYDETKISWWTLFKFRRFVARRKKGIPVAYLTHSREFFGYDFYVDRHVLVPRPDTEILVEQARDFMKPMKAPLLIDVGTGSGCIALSLLKELPHLYALALDFSKGALKVAQKNAKRLGVQDRIELRHSDLLGAVKPEDISGHDLVITANLPYLPENFQETFGLEHEPAMALWAGKEGTSYYERLAPQIEALKPCAVFLELFDFQIPKMESLLPDYRTEKIVPMSHKARLIMLVPVYTKS